ncbi:MarR family transcriptional regulator [Dietzia sp. 111N12-1]|uniref:MarR family transcriptional regulator n=1 Tax=Dietzia sp. 111N12-1 TaxID=1785156 RepID=UPI000804952A|nr:MarR family transcriptional regulator [Dietzia sp. 111N12-1]OAV78097.1 hypothetical protein AYO52_13620 [Dietzia sp. 111N12-1]
MKAFYAEMAQSPAFTTGIGIFNYSDALGEHAFPGRTALAEAQGTTPRTITRHIDQLIKSGWIERTREGRSGGRRGLASEYRLSYPSATQQTPPEAPLPAEEQGTSVSPLPSPEQRTFAEEQRTSVTEQRTFRDRNRGHLDVHPTDPDQIKGSNQSSPTRAGAREGAPATQLVAVDERLADPKVLKELFKVSDAIPDLSAEEEQIATRLVGDGFLSPFIIRRLERRRAS